MGRASVTFGQHHSFGNCRPLGKGERVELMKQKDITHNALSRKIETFKGNYPEITGNDCARLSLSTNNSSYPFEDQNKHV